MSRIIAPVLAFAALLGLSLAASRADDPLQEMRARQQIAVQKLTSQVEKAIADSRKLAPADAKFLLQDLLREVKDSREVPDAERTALVRRLEVRLSQVNGDKVAQDQRPSNDPPAPRKKFEIPDPPGRGGSGGGASGMAKDFIGNAKGASKNNAEMVRDREKGVLASSRDIERVLPMDKEINFPTNWKDITERRKDLVNPKLTEKEVKLLKTLNSTLKADYPEGSKFSAIISNLHDRTGLDIIVDPASLQDLNFDYDDPVTVPKIEKASVRTVLKTILGNKGLTYIIKEGAIHVMTPKKASEYTVVRTYPIGDLITPVQANRLMNPFMQQAQKQQAAQQIINLVVFMTGPDYWQPNGPGSISFFGDSLVIRASTEMHYQLASPGLFGR